MLCTNNDGNDKRRLSKILSRRAIKALGLVIAVLSLSACVKQATYNNSGKPAPISKVDNTEAAKTRVALGLQYLKVGQMSNAKFNLEKAKNFAPDLSSVHTAFAYYYQKVGESALAEQAYKKALSLDPYDADALNNYGTFLCRMKRYEEAEQTLLRAIKVPTYLQVAQSYENAALCAMENQQYDKAKQYFTQSLEHSALRANTLINIAGLSYAMGDYKQAQMFTQRLENVGVVSPRVLLLRSLIELKLGQVVQSKKFGTTLVSMYVKSPEALMYLSKSFENSEFEQLRRLYLKHQYQQFKQQNRQSTTTASSEAKAKRKLSPSSDGGKPIVQQLPQVNNTNVADASQNTNNRSDTSTSIAADIGQSLVKATSKPSSKSSSKPKAKLQSVTEPKLQSAQSLKPSSSSKPSPRANQIDVSKLKVPFHRVEPGETLFDLSFKYNIKMKRLLQWNKLESPSKLLAGQKVYLNNPQIYHTIGAGDTLYGISLKYKIRIERLMQWNDLQENVNLVAGQRILIVNPKQYFL